MPCPWWAYKVQRLYPDRLALESDCLCSLLYLKLCLIRVMCVMWYMGCMVAHQFVLMLNKVQSSIPELGLSVHVLLCLHRFSPVFPATKNRSAVATKVAHHRVPADPSSSMIGCQMHSA